VKEPLRVWLTEGAEGLAQGIAAELEVGRDVVIDAAARVVTIEQVRTILEQDRKDQAAWDAAKPKVGAS
jgi:hypothetical protein